MGDHPLFMPDDYNHSSFLGRRFELERLHDRLNPTHSPIVVVQGAWGVGKTAFCHAYTRQFAKAYAAIINVSAWRLSGSASIEQEMAHLVLRELEAKLSENANSGLLGAIKRDESENSAASSYKAIAILFKAFRTSGQKPFLLIVDDCDRLPEIEAVKVFRLLHEIADPLRVIVPMANAPGHYNWVSNKIQIMPLPPLEGEESELLLETLASKQFGKPIDAQQLIAQLNSLRADWKRLSPRFLIRLLNDYQREGSAEVALRHVLQRYFGLVQNLGIASTPNGLKVLPLAHLDSLPILTPSSEIVSAVPFIVLPNFRNFWRGVLGEFEHLINDPSTTEAKIQAFFERNPQFLTGIEYEKAIAHPILSRDEDGDLIPDFFLKPRASQLIDVLDLKLPSQRIVVGKKDRKKLSGAVTEAIAQVREYRDYFEREDYQKKVFKRYGVKGYRPNTIVVIGRDPKDVPEEKLRQITSEYPHHLKIMTYDNLFAKMKAIAEKNLL